VNLVTVYKENVTVAVSNGDPVPRKNQFASVKDAAIQSRHYTVALRQISRILVKRRAIFFVERY
jgi:hypothetical protein